MCRLLEISNILKEYSSSVDFIASRWPIVLELNTFQTWGMISSLAFDDFKAFVDDFSPGLISSLCFMKYFNFFNRESVRFPYPGVNGNS